MRKFWSWDNPLVLLPASYILLTNSPDNTVEAVIWWALVSLVAISIVSVGRGAFRRYSHWDPLVNESAKIRRANDKTLRTRSRSRAFTRV